MILAFGIKIGRISFSVSIKHNLVHKSYMAAWGVTSKYTKIVFRKPASVSSLHVRKCACEAGSKDTTSPRLWVTDSSNGMGRAPCGSWTSAGSPGLYCSWRALWALTVILSLSSQCSWHLLSTYCVPFVCKYNVFSTTTFLRLENYGLGLNNLA